MTEGYGRRELQTTALTLGSTGQGVRVVGVYRNIDAALVGDRRRAEAGAGDREARAKFLSGLESAIGGPDNPNSLNSRIADFDTALIEASSRPDSEGRLARVAQAASSLALHINNVGNEIQTARASADHQIEKQVFQVNTAVLRVSELNVQIRANAVSGRDASALMDQRQQLVDGIAQIVPIREVARDDGQIALFTTGGATLLDGRPAQLGYAPVGIVAAGMTLGNGSLSGLTLNGRLIATSGENSPILGGALASQFAIRDELGPAAQARLDAVSRDLLTRFSSGFDPSLTSGAPGLFVDSLGPFQPANETGLSQRLMLNSVIDPAQGGALWRLRDGLGATAPGPAGNAGLLNSFQAALTAQQSPASGGFMAGARSFSTLAADMLSAVASARLSAEGEASYSLARADALRGMELEGGVDTDQELQTLLLIEQSFAANAKVIQTVDDLIQTLLRI